MTKSDQKTTSYLSIFIRGALAGALLTALLPPKVERAVDATSFDTCSPSDFNWSTKESTSLDLPPNFIALEVMGLRL